MANLPVNPTNGQVFIDSERIRWQFNADLEVWENVGTVEDLPLASDINDGLLSYQLQSILNKTPKVGGGFGIIVDTKLVLQTKENPEGVIYGDIVLRSESLDIVCVGS